MMKLLNTVLVFTVLVAAFALYTLEHRTRSTERTIADLNHQIEDAHESTKLLKAEWSSLTRLDRVEKLAAENLQLEPTKATQFVSVEDLLVKVPATVPVKLEEEGKDPIGDILEKMQQ